MEESEKCVSSSAGTPISFKKPVLIGKVGRLPRKVLSVPATRDESKEDDVSTSETPIEDETNEAEPIDQSMAAPHPLPENTKSLPYKEPTWSGLPSTSSTIYGFEVLKSGSIIDTVDLMTKPFWIFGRLANCDISMAHPTISRYHAVLQYKCENTDEQPEGFYIYDLSSTHGTFLNKSRLKPRVYARVKVGHIIKLGCSTRNYILTGPDEDTDEPSQLSVTELKNLRAQELVRRQKEQEDARLKVEQNEEARKKKEEERGVDWGMGEDADEETDLAENPYAQTNNEELYLEDPKKALRGFMEREGLDLEYDCKEQGMGQFLCRVNLPVDDDKGRAVVAEVLHKGKKKEAVIQCALEACRILDRHGLLRQATHESRKRKTKNWEDNDYYDSDDDIFLDRTGTVEKKRENRMKIKIPQQPETYQGLLEKQKTLNEEIANIKHQLEVSKNLYTQQTDDSEDSLDSYMKKLKQPKLDKEKITKLKTELNKFQQEYVNIIKLLNIARPADLPPLIVETKLNKQNVNTKGKLPMFGKRIKVKVQKPVMTQDELSKHDSDDNENEIGVDKKVSQCQNRLDELENDFKTVILSLSTQQMEGLNNIWKTINELTFREQTMVLDIHQIGKQIDAMVGHSDPRYLVQLKKILQELKVSKHENKHHYNEELLQVAKGMLEERVNEVAEKRSSKQDGENLKRVKDATDLKVDSIVCSRLHEDDKNIEESADESERKRKKNLRRIQQRQEKTQAERIKGYEEDAQKEDYNMWVPPKDQTGDGRTSLNDKFGY